MTQGRSGKVITSDKNMATSDENDWNDEADWEHSSVSSATQSRKSRLYHDLLCNF